MIFVLFLPKNKEQNFFVCIFTLFSGANFCLANCSLALVGIGLPDSPSEKCDLDGHIFSQCIDFLVLWRTGPQNTRRTVEDTGPYTHALKCSKNFRF